MMAATQIQIPASLNEKIHKPVSESDRKWIVRNIWKQQTLTDAQYRNDKNQYDAYFDNYQSHCRQCDVYGLGQLRHSDMFNALNLIKEEAKVKSRQDLLDLLSKDPLPFTQPKEVKEFVKDWIDFVACSLLLLDVSTWADDKTLDGFLNSSHLFTKSNQTERARLHSAFSARNMDKMIGLKIRWTSVLSEHLCLENSDSQVAIFHQVGALRLLQASTILPPDFFEETRRTLSILLRKVGDPNRKKWFRKQRQHYQLGIGMTDFDQLPTAQREIQSFDYWRDRLIILKEEFDDHAPQNIFQYWFDNRKPAQWWAFWVAVAAFVFGITQVVEGLIQCYKAYYPST